MSMDDSLPPGTRRVIDGQLRVHYYGYWIKAYPVPADTLRAKKALIEALTRRLFNHTEHGLNIPGFRLEEARRSYDAEPDPRKRRVKAAMLAGTLFNRATDIFTHLVELQACGVEIRTDNALMRECGASLQEALQLGRHVLHRSGEEGIDELWGEPFRAFTIPIEDFFESRYVKIAQAMRDIDRISDAMVECFASLPWFAGIDAFVRPFGEAAKLKTETLRTDVDIFDVWSSFVAASERLREFEPRLPAEVSSEELRFSNDAQRLIRQGCDLIVDITRARVSMPKSTREFIERTHELRGAA